jgi:hypothetical protein
MESIAPERKAYIAGPMRGYESFNFPLFNHVAAALRANGKIVFNPAEMDVIDGFDPDTADVVPDIADFMARDLPYVCRCDEVWVLPNWIFSEGARLEVATAYALGKQIIDWESGLQIVPDLPSRARKLPEVNITIPDAPHASPVVGSSLRGVERRVTDAKTGGQKGVKPERFDLIPVEPLEEIARVYGYGTIKYAEDNWRKGYSWRLNFGAMMRHAWAFWRGEDKDPESGLHHLAHVAWHCLTLMWFQKYKSELDDRPFKFEAENEPAEISLRAPDGIYPERDL